MKRIILLLCFFMLINNFLAAQETELAPDFKIGVTGGLAVYFENDLKKINSEIIQNLPFDTELVNNFPPYFCYGFYILEGFGEKFFFGPSYNFYTTGSRIGAKDYSGSYMFDQILSAHSLGIQFELLLVKKSKLNFYIEALGGANFARWKINETIVLQDDKQIDKEEYRAIKPFVYPGVKIFWLLSNHFGLVAKAGVSVDISGKYKSKDNPDWQTDTNANFTGPKIVVGLEYIR